MLDQRIAEIKVRLGVIRLQANCFFKCVGGLREIVRHLTESRFHPLWQGQGNNDIAVALLQTAPAVTPKPWNQVSITALTGQTIRAVGYGANMGGTMPTGGGVRRQVNLTFRMIFQDIFFLGDGSGHGVCHGDSGGPSFFTFSDGVERVVGVHSFTTNEACTTSVRRRSIARFSTGVSGRVSCSSCLARFRLTLRPERWSTAISPRKPGACC